MVIELKIIELFAGIGTQFQVCRDIFLNCECLGISEIDKRPLAAYEKLHEKPHNWGDITTIKSLPQADIWFYSFPCTDLSIAGKQAGIENGKHSSLLYEVERLLAVSPKPQYLIMENVANLASEKFMSQFTNWINSLSFYGYNSVWKKVKACNYGGATTRNRIFMVSSLDGIYDFPAFITPTTTLIDFLEPLDSQYKIDKSNLQDIDKPYYAGSKKLADYKNGGQGNRIYSTLGQGVTLTSSGGGHAGSSGGLYLRNGGVYKLSPIEMCKVMGWTKEEAEKICSVLSPREVGFCLGNAIDRICLQEIVKHLTF